MRRLLDKGSDAPSECPLPAAQGQRKTFSGSTVGIFCAKAIERVSQLVWTEPGFPVELGGAVKLHAVPAGRDRTLLPSLSGARGKSGKAKDLFVVFSPGKPILAIFRPQ